MKQRIILPLLFACVLPALIAGIMLGKKPRIPNSNPTEVSTEPNTMLLSVIVNGQRIPMELEQYVTGVVLGEMPTDFHIEALKAQAVVARTVARHKMENPKHENGVICTDAGCCQAFLPEDAFVSAGGKTEELEKVKTAVMDTAGQVILCQGELIEATYFSCSGGRTEDAQAVWGTDIPYLQAVDSPGEEKATYFTETLTFTTGQFCERLGIHPKSSAESWVGEITYSDGGGVQSIAIDGTVFTGVQLRKLLGLKSTAFVITCLGDRVTVTTKGFGHRVGMSQYGADAMATSGKTYREILAHYYQNTTLSS